MKVIVTQPKVFKAGPDGTGSIPIKIGTEIEIDGDTIPGYLVGKVDIVHPPVEDEAEPKTDERVAVTNPKK